MKHVGPSQLAYWLERVTWTDRIKSPVFWFFFTCWLAFTHFLLLPFLAYFPEGPMAAEAVPMLTIITCAVPLYWWAVKHAIASDRYVKYCSEQEEIEREIAKEVQISEKD